MKKVEDKIFRGYDIRGIYNKDLTEETAYLIGRAFGTKLKEEQKDNPIIGYDNRESSIPLFESLVKGLMESGINVTSIGLVTTPMYYYTLYNNKATSGIMITASHNPKEYNGFKMTFNGIYNTYGEFIQKFKERINKGKFINGKGSLKKLDIKEEYINYLTKDINLGKNIPKVVIDCGNGTASTIAEDVFKKLNIPYIPIFCDSNPNFPNHHPDPSVEENLVDLKKTVLKEKARCGFGFDGDGDRIGLVDELGNMINIDLFMIIILRNIMSKLKNQNILFDVKCSKSLSDEIIKLGGNPICYRTGNSYMRAKVVADNLEFGGELSGHVFFNDRFHGYDDGIYAALRLVEILSHTNKNVSDFLEGINEYYSTKEEKIKVTDENKFDIINEMIDYAKEKNYKILTIDGLKVLFDDGFALIRASNTGPNLTTRFEAKTEKRLKEIKEEFITVLENVLEKY